MANEQVIETHILRSLTVALEKRKKGDLKDYNKVIKALEASPITTLVYWMRALIKCISMVDKDCTELVTILLRYQYQCGPETNDTFAKLLVNLITVNQEYLNSICAKLVKDMVPAPVEGDSKITADMIGEVAVSLANKITVISPNAQAQLYSCLEKNFPHKSQPIEKIEGYVKNLFLIATECIVLRDKILELLVTAMIQIDAEISVNDEDDDDAGENDLIFQLEEPSNQTTNSTSSTEAANKLDAMMSHFFNYLDKQLSKDKKGADDLLQACLKIFDALILTTTKSKYVQFIIFYICSKFPTYSQFFIGFLLQKTTDVYSSNFVKESSIAYIGSFLARANYIAPALLHSSLVTLCSWAANYTLANQNASPDPVKHSMFYHLCQAIFYICCFRLENLLDRMTREECLAAYQLVPIIKSSLNPFKICASFLVNEFTEISHKLNVTKLAAICDEVLKLNEQIATLVQPIEVNFPFDPYLLKHSSEYVTNLYHTWDDKLTDREDSYSEEFGSLPDEFDHYMSFTPDTGFDIDAHFAHSPMV